ncbi:MAG: hypothetical protein LBQ40_04490 [Clostridiales bacterium]|jgi:hypothetical protein|nr:hypothetical protein [Clostridiales bacterium]
MTYPPWWNNTLTIYKKGEDAERNTVWTSAVIDGCAFTVTYNRAESGDNEKVIPAFIVRVRKGAELSVKTGDVVIKSGVEEAIDESEDGRRMSDIMAKYGDDAFIVKATKDNTNLADAFLPHYFIGG